MQVATTVTFTGQELADFFITAFEGGSNYWVDTAYPAGVGVGLKPWYADPEFWAKPFTVKMVDTDGEGVEFNEVMLQQGLTKLSQDDPLTFGDLVSGNYDADTADTLLQYVCFLEIVYG
jgi:hypothetical protein